jgi:hypothetical protein
MLAEAPRKQPVGAAAAAGTPVAAIIKFGLLGSSYAAIRCLLAGRNGVSSDVRRLGAQDKKQAW